MKGIRGPENQRGSMEAAVIDINVTASHTGVGYPGAL
jgi:hypothetical protein